MHPHWTEYFTALLTPTVALLGTLIAIFQWRIAKGKLRLELFDRRAKVHQAANSLVSAILTKGSTDNTNEVAFLSGTRGAEWLFGKEICTYLNDELWSNACDLSAIEDQLKGLAVGSQRDHLIQERARLKKWFLAQYKEIDRIFSPYMSVSYWA